MQDERVAALNKVYKAVVMNERAIWLLAISIIIFCIFAYFSFMEQNKLKGFGLSFVALVQIYQVVLTVRTTSMLKKFL